MNRIGMTDSDYEQMRRAMVASQLRTTGVNDPGVVAAMNVVPRERFVPEARRGTAYADAAIPLTEGRTLNPPMATGRLLAEARPAPRDRVLLVGAATGYAAAVLARMGAAVVALESDPVLAAHARSALAGTSVQVVEGPLEAGHAAGAPYDLILIDGAVEAVPQALVDQLADGGRLAGGIVERGVSRLALGRRTGGGFGILPFADADAALLPGFAPVPEFSF